MRDRLKLKKGQQKELLRKFLDINNLSIRRAAQAIQIGETTLKRWLREETTLPAEVFYQLCENNPELKSYKDKIEARLPSNWGQIKGGKTRIKKIHDLDKYLFTIRAKKDAKRLESALLLKKKRKVTNVILTELIREGVNLKQVLATCLLTDGSLTVDGESYRISYYTKDEVLRAFIGALLFKLSKFVPSEILSKKGVYAIRVSDGYLSKELLKLSPSYKKNPKNGQSSVSYLNEIQPSLKFLIDTDEKTIRWCIRFAFSTDGAISISRNNIKELNLSCYHPVLSCEWTEIIKKYKIRGHLGKDRNSWSKIKGVRIYDSASLQNFAAMGGFIPGVRITNKSKRYKGLEKNTLLKQVLGARSFPAR